MPDLAWGSKLSIEALKEQEVQLKPRAAHTMVSSNMKKYSYFIRCHPLKDEGEHMDTG